MKNILILFLVSFIALAVNAQGTYKGVAQLGTNGDQDTLTNAATVTYALGVNLTKPGDMSFGVNVTKVSGTVAGIIYYQGSVDNTNFVTVDTDTLTDATNTYHSTLANWTWPYARISVVGSGTSVRYIIPSMAYRQTR